MFGVCRLLRIVICVLLCFRFVCHVLRGDWWVLLVRLLFVVGGLLCWLLRGDCR